MNLEQEITHDSSRGPRDESSDVDNPWIVTHDLGGRDFKRHNSEVIKTPVLQNHEHESRLSSAHY